MVWKEGTMHDANFWVKKQVSCLNGEEWDEWGMTGCFQISFILS